MRISAYGSIFNVYSCIRTLIFQNLKYNVNSKYSLSRIIERQKVCSRTQWPNQVEYILVRKFTEKYLSIHDMTLNYCGYLNTYHLNTGNNWKPNFLKFFIQPWWLGSLERHPFSFSRLEPLRPVDWSPLEVRYHSRYYY